MSKIKLGLQIYAVREDFEEAPAETLKRIAEIGYKGVEMNYFMFNQTAEFYAQALADAGLECYSVMIGEDHLQAAEEDPHVLEEIMQYCRTLGCEAIVIGAYNLKPIAEDPTYADKIIERTKAAAEKIRAAGFKVGFHNHDFDHLTKVDENKTFFEFLFENITDDFMLLMDTGNCMGGNADPIEIIKRFPGRTEIAHFKGFSSELRYLTPVWKAEIDSDELIRTLVEVGKAQKFSVEFGARGGYVPFERAEQSYVWLSNKLKEKGLL